MQIKHRFQAPTLEEIKEKVRDSKLTPVVVTAVAVVAAMCLVTKKQETQITINVNHYERD